MSSVADHGDSRTAVIAAFPATGKTYLSASRPAFYDSDSSLYSHQPDWPDNYFRHIADFMERGRTDPGLAALFVSTHTEVREGLEKRGIPFVLVYPHLDLRDEYVQRLRDRGSPEGMCALVFSKWDRFLAECAFQRGCVHVVLGSGQYLSDVVQL